MTITNGYCTLAELHSRLDIPISTTTWDSELEIMIESASRGIDSYCNRRFYQSSSDETFYYTPQSYDTCFIDDLMSLTSLKTDDDYDGTYETTWSSNDYYLWPYNENPKTVIELTGYGDLFFYPSIPRSVQVIGKFGYSVTAPSDVKEACLIWCSRLWKRRDAPLGIEGTSQFGMVRLMATKDPDILWLLRPYVRMTS